MTTVDDQREGDQSMSSERTAVDARNDSLPNSDIVDQDEDTTMIADQNASCQWNGVEFADGAGVCAQGMAYECNLGKWVKMPGGC
jgi:hypothetical protein